MIGLEAYLHAFIRRESYSSQSPVDAVMGGDGTIPIYAHQSAALALHYFYELLGNLINDALVSTSSKTGEFFSG